ncbi:type IV pilin-like G/H family protein [Cyanothece sp. BG0011]|uniref:type IV pilin-like G/H family protein n=1 Tax=Cyanothece sp. BG0011 TaxID=2082950 RepID=UPI000D1FC94F|nr:type IV pilin-like G/H family protein [Cyanothece sp. BG0011]
MMQPLTNQQRWITGTLAGLVLGTSLMGVAVTTQAQEEVKPEPEEQEQVMSKEEQAKQAQAKALELVTKMTEAQRSYYEENGEFQVVIDEIAEDLDLTLPSSFNYGIRTSFQGAYIYVLPSKSPLADQLKAYVGGAFIKSPQKEAENKEQNQEIVTIICETTETGRRRPADPQIARAKDVNSNTEPSLSCADSTVPAPKFNQK